MDLLKHVRARNQFRRLLFAVKHGSHLYGLNHAGSDLDVYRVYEGKNKNAQSIIDGIDYCDTSLDRFLAQAGKGVPQALEAMFATDPVVDEISELRGGFRIDLTRTADTYRRTIKNFALTYEDVKRQRHGIRLALNLRSMWATGRFDPTLSDLEKELLFEWEGGDTNDLIDIIESISPIEIF